jgi:ATP synthase protein I
MTTAPVTNGSAARPHRPATAGGQVRSAALVTLALALVGALLGALLSGAPAAVGAALGAGIVLVFFGTGAVVVNAVAAVSPAASLVVALLTYTLEVALVALVLTGLERSGLLGDTVDRAWTGGAVIAATLVWLVAHIVSATRARMPVYDLPETAHNGPEASAR